MGNRCTGHCCRRFTLPFTPEQLELMTQVHAEWVEDQEAGWPEGVIHAQDIEIIGPMVIPIGPSDTDGYYFYTCRNLLESGDCAIYETRPKMCRDFPYGQTCPFAECTWTNRAAAK